ncbi:MAG: hypothetical protein BZ138_05685, partial [Methanosphaera sp. rholeuAM270]
YNETAQPVTTGSVNLTINGQDYTANLDVTTGEYYYDYVPTANGTLTINASYIKDDTIIVTSEDVLLLVNKINSTTKVAIINNTAGNVTLNISVEGADGNKTMIGEVSIIIDGNNLVPLNLDGQESYIVNLADNLKHAGLVSVQVIFNENDNYYSSEAENNEIEVMNQTSKLEIGMLEDNVVNSTTAVIVGKLTDDLGNNITDAYVEIIVDGEKVGIAKTNSTGEFIFEYVTDKLGEITVNATYYGDNIMYYNATDSTKFYVYKLNTTVKLNVSDIGYTELEVVNITINETGATGRVTVEVTSDVEGFNPITVYTDFNGETLQLPLSDLKAGKYEVTVTYDGDGQYKGNTTTRAFTVNKKVDYKLNVTAHNIRFDDDEIIIVNLPSDAKGLVTVNVTGMSPATINLADGNVLTIPGGSLLPGDYEVNISYTDDNYDLKTNHTGFSVYRNPIEVYVFAQNITYGYNETVTVSLSEFESADGNISVVISDDSGVVLDYIVVCPDDLDGGFNYTLVENLKPGKYFVEVEYVNDTQFEDAYADTQFSVSMPVVTIYDSQTIYVNDSVIIHGSVRDDNTNLEDDAEIILDINGTKYNLGINDYDEGLTHLFTASGTYTVNATLVLFGKTITTSDNIRIVVNKIPTTTTIKVLNSTMESTCIDIVVKEDATGKHSDVLTSGTVNVIVGKEIIPVTLKGENTTICLNDYISSSGNVEVKAVYPESEQYISSNATVNINVRKLNTTITLDATSPVDVGNVSVFAGKLIDENGKPISDAKVVLRVDNVVVANVATDKDGLYSFDYDKCVVGTHNVSASYEGNKTFINSAAKTKFTVNKVETQITLEDIDDVTIGETIIIKGKLVDKYNNPVSNANIKITMGSEKTTAKTDSKGNYNATLAANSLGNKDVKVVFAGDDKYVESQASEDLKVLKVKPTITVDVPKTVTLNDVVDITGNIKDAEGNNIAGLPVNVTVNGKTYTTSTDKNGNYNVGNVNKVPGQNTVSVTAGNSTVEETTVAKTFNTRKINTTLTLNPNKDVIVGQKVNVTGKLVDENSKPIAKASVTVILDGVSKTVRTDNNGNYNAEFSTSSVGDKKATATYSGNDTYATSNANGKVKIVKNNATLTVKTPGDAIANKALNISGTLKDKDGKAVANTPVTVTVNGKKYTAITDSKGNYKVEVNNVKVGQNNVTVASSSDKYNIKPVTAKFNARLPKSKITVNKVSDAKVGDNITISGKLVDEQNNPIKDAKVSVKVNNKTYEARTDNKGNYKLSNPDLVSGVDNVTVSYTSTLYKSSSAKTTFKVTKLKTKVTVQSINGTIGEDITLTAFVTDERGGKVTGGNLVFKLNGKTLRVDGRFDSDASPLKLKVENGVVKYTIKADLYMRNGKNITASYSGSYRYDEAKGNVAQANIKKRNASIKVTITPKRAKQNSEIVFTATLKDITPKAKNATCITTGGDVIFKVNGVTVKDNKGQTIRVKVNSTTVNLAYHVPSGMGGMDAKGIKNYTVEAVYNNSMFYPDTRNTSSFYVQQSIVVVNFIKTSVKNNVLSVRATFTDYENKNVIGDNKVCVKINGKTYQENNKTKYFTVTNGKVDLSGIKLAKGTVVSSVTLVTGEREGYLGARATTTNITNG